MHKTYNNLIIIYIFFLQITIEMVDEGQPPSEVTFKADNMDQSKSVQAYLLALGYQAKTCSLNFGDGTIEHFEEVDMIFSTVQEHTYETIGFYGVKAECENAYGSTSDIETIVVVNPPLEYEYQSRHVDIVIPIIGANVESNNLLVFVNSHETDAMKTENDVIIDEAVFSYSGEQLVQLKSNNKIMYTKVLNLQTPVDEVRIDASIIHAEVDDEIEIEFSIGKGDQMQVWISYGDGKEEFLYYPSPEIPVVLNRNHTYSNLGIYSVEIVVANEVSSKKAIQVMSIERPLELAQVSSHNITQLGQPTTFTFDIDQHMSPAMPVEITIDYNDGVIESIILGKQQQLPVLLNITHTYNTFNIYRITASVANNISSIDVSTLIQVGENITYVDLYSDKERVEVDEQIEFRIHCPRGTPIQLDLDFGDDTEITIHRPEVINQYLDGIIPSTTPETTGSAAIEEDSSGEFIDAFNITAARRKRSAEPFDEGSGEITEEVEDVLYNVLGDAVLTQPQREDFIVRYNYSKPGTYVVRAKVSNKFGFAENFLCPAIVVAKLNAKSVSCSQLSVTITNSSSEDNPLVVMRSKEIILDMDTVTQCTDSLSGNLKTRYTWSAQKLSPYNEWRPELAVCQNEIESDMLVIHPNTLWYGSYKLTTRSSIRTAASRKRRDTYVDAMLDVNPVEMFAEKEIFEPVLVLDDTEGTLLTSDMAVSYLHIIPTPLVAHIRDEEKVHKDVVRWTPVTVDMSNSYDPDVPAGKNNKTGMTFHLFCYQKRFAEVVATKTFEQLLEESSKVANNTVDSTRLYEFEHCFESFEHIWVLGQEAIFPGDHLTTNDTIIFDGYVTKDERMSRTSMSYKIWATNITVENAMDAIDDLLASGDTSAALMVIDMAANALNSVAGVSMQTKKNHYYFLKTKYCFSLG